MPGVFLCEKEGMEFVHEPVVEGCKIFQTIRTRFLQAFEEEDLCAWIELLQELAQLSHGITTRRNAEDIVHKALHELLSDVLTIQIAIWKFT